MPDHTDTGLRRRSVVAALTALPLVAIHTRPAKAADFNLKIANAQPATHPINVRLVEAAARLLASSGGRIQIRVFPDSQLGSEIDLLSQLRSGALDLMNISSLVLSSAVAATSLVNVGFAFSDYRQAFAAVDGKLGDYIRAQIEKAGMMSPFMMANSGFRQITSSDVAVHGPADLRGFRIRVPVSPLNLSLFSALGAAPTTVNFNETYTALQTRLVQGQENPLVIVESSKMYEVQKYCTLTNHMWDGYWILVNRRSFSRLPKSLQDSLVSEINQAITSERVDTQEGDGALQKTLTSQGLTFIQPDPGAFRDALLKTNFYQTWKEKFGNEAWSLLESTSGNLG